MVLAAGAGNPANYTGFLVGEGAATVTPRRFTAMFTALFRRIGKTAAGFPPLWDRPYIKMWS